MYNRIICGDAAETLRTLPAESINCCVTSPPYYGLRDYGMDRQIGLEQTPEEYINRLVSVFQEVRRLLKNDGTLWVVIADSYAGSGKGAVSADKAKKLKNEQSYKVTTDNPAAKLPKVWDGIKPKDMLGIPWLLAFALRADGWYLRSSIIWHKPNALPESCRDRPTRSYEYIFLLSKSGQYYYDNEAVREPVADGTKTRMKRAVSDNHKYANIHTGRSQQTFNRPRPNRSGEDITIPETRNLRDFWSVPTKPYRGAHFATFPSELITPCILAGCPSGGVVLDPFAGSGTACFAAAVLGRQYVGIDINPDYCLLAEERLKCGEENVPI